jgi:hypothetical protein
MSSEDDLVAVFSGRLRVWASAFARQHGLAGETLRIEPRLHIDEVTGLALALNAGLVQVQSNGMFRLSGAKPGKGPYNLFSRGVTPSLNREYLVQIAAFAELVLQHRWPARQVVFEYDALDLAVFEDGGYPVVAEVKRDAASLHVMLAQMNAATADHVLQPVSTAQRKVAAMARLRPELFWAVAPGVRLPFEVEIDRDGVPRLRPRDALPRGPRTELECPVCGSEEDVRGRPLPDGRISLNCTSCDHRWSRTPRKPCRRCGSADVQTGGDLGWAYEDLDAAAEDTMTPWHYVEWDTYRCRKCHHVWQVGHRAG